MDVTGKGLKIKFEKMISLPKLTKFLKCAVQMTARVGIRGEFKELRN